MTLPVTITGISTAVAPVGPFKVAAGGYGVKALEVVGGGTGQNAPVEGPGQATEARGQEFTNGGSSLTVASVSFLLTKTGTPTGNLYANIYSGNPSSGSLLATSDELAASLVTATAFPNGTLLTFTFPSPPTISASALFTVTLHRTVGDAANYVNNSYVAGTTYAGGQTWGYSAGSGWQQGGIDFHCLVNSLVTLASDVYYFFGRNGTTATTLSAFKSTAPDTSWASIATKTGFTTAILSIAGCQSNSTIHLLVQDGTAATSVATKYVSFDALTDTFLATTETVAAAQSNAGQAGSNPVSSLWSSAPTVKSLRSTTACRPRLLAPFVPAFITGDGQPSTLGQRKHRLTATSLVTAMAFLLRLAHRIVFILFITTTQSGAFKDT